MLSSIDGFAAEVIGMVVSVRGEVTVISNGESRPLKQMGLLYENDEITVNERSFAVLQFVDKAKATLRPDSRLIIEQYAADAVTLNLVSGSVRVVAGSIASTQPESFRIRTPVSLLSTQGNESSLSVCGDKICDQKGLVEVPE